ncbi:Type III effector pipB2 [Thiorhodovibrio winogradskyi]|uniref:Type III effector pipB2 n=1 Tax=Thiorhodovibrio winogradskyi TaxID=77007 RepID=A0ABZ0S9U0_9GAMM|nr:DUF2169 domain-containing protein [Thiorhodovibrio winogradskyi]
MKVIKPDHLSLLPTIDAIAGESRLVLSLFAGFPLSAARDAHGQPALMEEADIWQALATALGEGDVFDAGRPKPRAEFLVQGACVPPKPIEICPVRVRVGQVVKELMVFGERFREGALGLPGQPEPFQRIPLSWQSTFGGAKMPANPFGKGRDLDASGRRPLPNVILAAEHPLSPGRDPSPASLQAVPVWWPSRSKHLGSFNARWLAAGGRELPMTTNPLVHMSASPDQWMEGFLTGDEDFELTHLHPSRPIISGTLPGLRTRAFVASPGKQPDQLREVETVADTLWFLPELDIGIICYRGILMIEDEDADDIGYVILGQESLAVAPLPADHYLEQARAALFPPDEEPFASQDARQPDQSPAAEPGASPPTEPPVESPAMADFHAEMARIQSESREMLAKMGYNQEQMAELVQKYEAQAKEMAKSLPDKSLPDKSLEEMLEEARIQTQAFTAKQCVTPEESLAAAQRHQPQPPSLEEIDAMLTKGQITPEAAGQMREAHAALAGFLAFLATMGAEKPIASSANQSAPRDGSTREGDLGQDETTSDPAGRDLSGRDFSGQDLSGRDFSGALLERARFDGANLSGALFTESVLTEAVFTRACCAGAVFAQADAWRANFQEADLSGADLAEADFTSGNFAGANLSQAKGSRAGFHQARMTGIQASQSRFPDADFSRADLTDALLEQADLSNADFDQAVLRGANLAQARAVNARFGGADLSGSVLAQALLRESRADAETSFRDADLRDSQAERAQWSGADLTATNLERATLTGADLSRARLSGAKLARSLAKNADFSKAVLDQADMRLANLMEASFALASLREARLTGANCFAADLRKTVLGGADLDQANLKRTLLDLEMLDALA